jgi:hypothetical protein
MSRSHHDKPWQTMAKKTPTGELPASDVYDIGEIRERLLEVVDRLRFVDQEIQELTAVVGTLTKLADKLDTLSKNLAPPDLHEVLAEIDAPYAVHNMRYLAERLTEAILLVPELMADAEITGSKEAYDKAKTWLESLGILMD